MDSRPVYFHVDMDAFFASIEQNDNPEYRGKPVVVGAKPGGRGVAAACSYEARRFGIRSAMPINEAKRRCPEAVFLPVRMNRYGEVSRQVMSIFSFFTPEVIPVSIDEASLNMTGTSGLFGPPASAARRIKERVHSETGLTISIGIASNRFLAKMASDFRKPDGLYEVKTENEIEFVDQIGLQKIWGVGAKTRERLQELGLSSTSSVRELSLDRLRFLLGNSTGLFLFHAVRGIDPGLYGESPKSHSISSETTFPVDTSDKELLSLTLLELAHHVMFRLFDEAGVSRTVCLKFRYSDFSTFSCRTTLDHTVAAAEELHRQAMELLESRWDRSLSIRLIGLGLENIGSGDEPSQGELFDSLYEKKGIVERTVYGLRKKALSAAPVKASLLGKKKHPG